jgi:hypothetical protein
LTKFLFYDIAIHMRLSYRNIDRAGIYQKIIARFLKLLSSFPPQREDQGKRALAALDSRLGPPREDNEGSPMVPMKRSHCLAGTFEKTVENSEEQPAPCCSCVRRTEGAEDFRHERDAAR